MTDSGGINFLSFINPGLAAQQQKLTMQQALAQKLMEEGNTPDKAEDVNRLANPGGLIIPYSPLQGLAKVGQSISGKYLQDKSIDEQAKLYGDLLSKPSGAPDGNNIDPTNTPQALGSLMQGNSGPGASAPSTSDLLWEHIAPEWQKSQYALRNAGPIKAAETAATPYVTPQGTYQMGSQIMASNKQPPAASMSAPAQPKSVAPQTPLVNDRAPASAPVVLTKNGQDINQTSADASTEPTAANAAPSTLPMAADGKPLLPNITKIPPPDPSGTPRFKTENTKTGVEQTIQDQKDAAEGNKAFAATAQSLGQEKARLDNLIQVYKDVQSGTLTAQNPEFFNKMAALGFNDDPKSIKDLAGIQNATQNHILQVIQQIKDTNANAGGGAPTRVFGSEISQLLENGESTKGQPEALWNVIGQAKGVVDHHLDMVNGWITAGGLGNRLAGGYTMRPDDFAQQFSTSHNIADYRDKALKEIGPFKGMAGNPAGASKGWSYGGVVKP